MCENVFFFSIFAFFTCLCTTLIPLLPFRVWYVKTNVFISLFCCYFSTWISLQSFTFLNDCLLPVSDSPPSEGISLICVFTCHLTQPAVNWAAFTVRKKLTGSCSIFKPQTGLFRVAKLYSSSKCGSKLVKFESNLTLSEFNCAQLRNPVDGKASMDQSLTSCLINNGSWKGLDQTTITPSMTLNHKYLYYPLEKFWFHNFCFICGTNCWRTLACLCLEGVSKTFHWP